MKRLVRRHFDLLFVFLFFALGMLLLWVPPRWDEDIYLGLANNVLLNPLNPWQYSSYLKLLGQSVPSPPLLWYLVALFYPLPRIAPLLVSTLAVVYLFYASKRLYGGEVAGLAAAAAVTNWLFMICSFIVFVDGPVSAFMGIAVVSFLCWANLKEKKFLLFCGLSVALASITRYTAAPILLVTFLIWLILLRKKFNKSDVLQLLSIVAISLIPLAYWIHQFSRFYGNPLFHYGARYELFPSGNLVFPLLNIAYYLPWAVTLVELQWITWFRQRQFDSNSKLIFIYAVIVFGFFSLLNAQQFRYLLPLVPPLSIVSAINLVREKPSVRFSILFAQFVIGVVITLVALVFYVFRTYPYRSF